MGKTVHQNIYFIFYYSLSVYLLNNLCKHSIYALDGRYTFETARNENRWLNEMHFQRKPKAKS